MNDKSLEALRTLIETLELIARVMEKSTPLTSELDKLILVALHTKSAFLFERLEAG